MGIRRLSKNTFVKFAGGSAMLTEARTLDFIATHTTIPVPRVHHVFKCGRTMFLTMDYIPGVELDVAWKEMSEQQQRDLLEELRGYINQLRALVPPRPGAIEAVDGTGVDDPWLSTIGPFDDIEPLHVSLGLTYVRQERLPADRYDEFESAVERCYTRGVNHEYSTRFVHGDLAPRNILVNPKTYRIAAIIDWQASGWLPEYWEYTQTYQSNWREPCWWELLRDHVLEPYPDELQARIATDIVIVR